MRVDFAGRVPGPAGRHGRERGRIEGRWPVSGLRPPLRVDPIAGRAVREGSS